MLEDTVQAYAGALRQNPSQFDAMRADIAKAVDNASSIPADERTALAERYAGTLAGAYVLGSHPNDPAGVSRAFYVSTGPAAAIDGLGWTFS